MAQAHDLAVIGPGGHFEAVGQRFALDGERVVAGRRERRRQPGEDPAAGMVVIGEVLPCISDFACTTFPPYACPIAWWPRHTPRIGSSPPKRSMTARYASLARRAGAGGDDDPVRSQLARPRRCHFVVSNDLHLRPELAEVLDEVVGELVVVVDHQQHAPALPPIVGPVRRSTLSARLTTISSSGRTTFCCWRSLRSKRALCAPASIRVCPITRPPTAARPKADPLPALRGRRGTHPAPGGRPVAQPGLAGTDSAARRSAAGGGDTAAEGPAVSFDLIRP